MGSDLCVERVYRCHAKWSAVDKPPQGAAFVIGFALFFEFFDVNLSGVLGTVLTEQFHVSSSVQPLLLGSAFLGMFLGASGLAGKRRFF